MWEMLANLCLSSGCWGISDVFFLIYDVLVEDEKDIGND
jgi:hypothetical protein